MLTQGQRIVARAYMRMILAAIMVFAAIMFLIAFAQAAPVSCHPESAAVQALNNYARDSKAEMQKLGAAETKRLMHKIGLGDAPIVFEATIVLTMPDGHLEFGLYSIDQGVVCVSPAFGVPASGAQYFWRVVKGEQS